jgi:GNAT superfamily N-acetyltransferase
MQDPELLALTESEPLTLEQEYANQISWATDASKYCFIVHSRRPVDQSSFRLPGSRGVQTALGVDYTLEDEQHAEALKKPVDVQWVEEDEEEQAEEQTAEATQEHASSVAAANSAADNIRAAESTSAIAAPVANSAAASTDVGNAPVPSAAASADPSAAASDASASQASSAVASAPTTAVTALPDPGSRWPLTPIGDVNLFLHADFNLGDYGVNGGGCEIEVMLARREYRGRGLATEAVKALMRFSERRLGVSRFVAKVLSTNKSSVTLFEKRLGFAMIEYVECFDECVFYKDTSATAGDDDVEEDEEDDDEEEAAEAASADSSSAVNAATAAAASSQQAASLPQGADDVAAGSSGAAASNADSLIDTAAQLRLGV